MLKNGSLDADSQAKVLDGLTARYQALHDGGKGSGDDPSNPGGAPQDPGGTPAPGAPGAPGAAGTDPGDTGGAGGDDPSLEGGLPSDAMMGGLGALGPAMGALGGCPRRWVRPFPGLAAVVAAWVIWARRSVAPCVIRAMTPPMRPPTSTPTR